MRGQTGLRTGYRWGARVLCLGILATGLSACKTTPPPLSLDEARTVTMRFAGADLAPPPRTIADITAILDQQPPADPDKISKLTARASAQPPKGARPRGLIRFYRKRAAAAGQIGDVQQRVSDLQLAAKLAKGQDWKTRSKVLWMLGDALQSTGKMKQSLLVREKALAIVPDGNDGWLLGRDAILALFTASFGDFDKADRMFAQSEALLNEATFWPGWTQHGHMWTASTEVTKAHILELRGQYARAEPLLRSALDHYQKDSILNPQRAKIWNIIEKVRAKLGMNLAHQGHLLAGEALVRKSLTASLTRVGRYYANTAKMVQLLASVLNMQGRHREAEQLNRAAIDILQQVGMKEGSPRLAKARHNLANTLTGQGKWREALKVYDRIGNTLASDNQSYGKFYASSVNRGLALVMTGQTTRALAVAKAAKARITDKAHAKGLALPPSKVDSLLALAYSTNGNWEQALRHFQQAVPRIVSNLNASRDTANLRWRDVLILERYIDVLAQLRNTQFPRSFQIDPVAEAFQIANVLNAQKVQQAVNDLGVRAAIGEPELAALARREQDTQKQISALHTLHAEITALPTPEQDATALSTLQNRIRQLERAHRTLEAEIQSRFPNYANLSAPPAPTLQEARAFLREGEALLMLHSGENRTYVWAIPHTGPVAFHVATMGDTDIQNTVRHLRRALDPGHIESLEDIPAFDLNSAYALYAKLLKPVESRLRGSDNVIVISNKSLSQLPLALLPTARVIANNDRTTLFDRYTTVPWLARRHSFTLLPSVTAMATLQRLRTVPSAPRPFIGFGDPFFNSAQFKAARKAATARRNAQLRNLPAPSTRSNYRLEHLPRLEDTSLEIVKIGETLGADLSKDIFLGTKANEATIKSMDLTPYRVISFATHGLRAGDLNGLRQPALALTSPKITGSQEDGLLTMGEILQLRLNADWAVLSACNTAAGENNDSEAISGLGRAFFYAGARSLLVSNWPVHSEATTELMTVLFDLQRHHPELNRAQLLQRSSLHMIENGVAIYGGKPAYSYAHPIFWAPFTLVGDSG